jgi:hypothetical protein
LEKHVFAREQGAGYYSLAAYFFSKIAVEMPFQIIFPWLGGYVSSITDNKNYHLLYGRIPQ